MLSSTHYSHSVRSVALSLDSLGLQRRGRRRRTDLKDLRDEVSA